MGRTILSTVPATTGAEGEGFIVRRPFPGGALDQIDPFLLLDEMGPAEHAPGDAKGAPDHPHRGFETVTYFLAGEFEHRDSAGNHGVLRPGDVQWMTAGAGVVHSEMPSATMREQGGRLHGFQLWVNLPRADKMTAPRYQDVPSAKIPVVVTSDGKVRVKVIAGDAAGASAVIETRTPIVYLHLSMQPAARFEQALPAAFNVFAYVFEGSAWVGDEGRKVNDGYLAVFNRDGDHVELRTADSRAEVLLIGGLPIDEPVARYGPFVMNEPDEIRRAFEDYRSGRMGRIG